MHTLIHSDSTQCIQQALIDSRLSTPYKFWQPHCFLFPQICYWPLDLTSKNVQILYHEFSAIFSKSFVFFQEYPFKIFQSSPFLQELPLLACPTIFASTPRWLSLPKLSRRENAFKSYELSCTDSAHPPILCCWEILLLGRKLRIKRNCLQRKGRKRK